jgi:hypothetical protein
MTPQQRHGLALALDNFRGAAELIEVQLRNGDAAGALETTENLRRYVALAHDWFFDADPSPNAH